MEIPPDVRLAARWLIRHPGFTAVAVFTLALGVGASTTMFSVLHGVVLQPLPYPEPERVVRLFPVAQRGQRAPWTGADFVDYSSRESSCEATAAFQYVDFSLLEGSVRRKVVGVSVTPDFFRVFAVAPTAGRLFDPAADAPGGPRAAVLADSFWRSRLAGDVGVIGGTIDLDGEPTTIVGVAPAGFAYPPGAQLWVASRFRVPESPSRADDPSDDRSDRYFHVVARLRGGVTPESATREGETIMSRLAHEHPTTNRDQGFELVRLHEVVVASVRPMLMALFGSALLVLLVACANVANILLARAAGRTHEIALRTSLGAERRHLIRQFLSESLLLGLLGGLAGVALALAGTRGLVGVIARELPRAAEISLSLPVLGFALGASLVSGLLFGVAPLLWLHESDPARTLQEGGSRGGAVGSRVRVRSALVAAEMAICLGLLVGASLLTRTLALLGSSDPGFSEPNVLTAQVWLPGSTAPSDDELRQLHAGVLERVRALPGVAAAGAVLSLPIEAAITARTDYSVEGRVGEPGSQPIAGLQAASPGYFASLGIPVLRGRAFSEADGPDAPPVAVVSQAFAEAFFPGEDPIGRRIGGGHPSEEGFEWWTIVGVVASTRHFGLGSQPRAEAYRPLAQEPSPWISLVLKTSVPPASLIEALRRAVAEVSPNQPVERVLTMSQILHESLARERVHAMLLGVFAGLTLVLAAVGLYGVMAFSVAARTREIGVRVAVGATPREIVRVVLFQAARLLLVGLLAGGVCALAVGRLLRSFLYGVPPADPPSFVAAIVVLSLAALLASLLPARRALRLDPMAALRIE